MVSLTLIVVGALFIVSWILIPWNPVTWLLAPWLEKGKSWITGLIRWGAIVGIITVIGRILGEHPLLYVLSEINKIVDIQFLIDLIPA